MGAYDSRTKLEALRDHFEIFGKGANYLLVGHGAGLVGCLSVLKDHPENLPQQFHGLGQLVLLFGTGLLLSSLFWGMSMLIKINVTQAIISEKQPSNTWSSWVYKRSTELLAHIMLWGSLIAFIAAIVLIMSQFTDAIPSGLLRWWSR
jgi:hypothetical protein